MKKVLTLTAALATMAMLAACGSSSAIVGEWEGSGRVSELEFFSDGTYTSSDANHSGSYSIDGNRIRLSGLLASDWVCDFNISGNTLTLSGDINAELTKVN